MIADEVPLTGEQFAVLNLELLIKLTRDQNRSNRDWASLLLNQEGGDTPDARAALLAAS